MLSIFMTGKIICATNNIMLLTAKLRLSGVQLTPVKQGVCKVMFAAKITPLMCLYLIISFIQIIITVLRFTFLLYKIHPQIRENQLKVSFVCVFTL